MGSKIRGEKVSTIAKELSWKRKAGPAYQEATGIAADVRSLDELEGLDGFQVAEVVCNEEGHEIDPDLTETAFDHAYGKLAREDQYEVPAPDGDSF